MSVAFYGTQETVVSFEADEVTAGCPVILSDNNTVTNATDGALFAGLALHVRGGVCAVQIKGFVTLPYSGSAPALGFSGIAADGQGGVKAMSGGRQCLVVSRDNEQKLLGFYL